MTNASAHGTRAKRFPIRASVHYRAGEADKWHVGRTENVSCSGALIAGRQRLPEAAAVEMLLPLPSQLSGKAEVHVLCRGRVVRVISPALPMFAPKFAVRWREMSVINGDHAALQQVPVGENWRTLIHDMYNEIAIIVGSTDLLAEIDEHRRVERVFAIKRACQRTATLLGRLSNLLAKDEHRLRS